MKGAILEVWGHSVNYSPMVLFYKGCTDTDTSTGIGTDTVLMYSHHPHENVTKPMTDTLLNGISDFIIETK